MKYEGRFRTLKDEMIHVVIITNNDVSQEKEIFFADESPVMISQSSDGIFSPIKSRSCTIKLVTKDELFDIYSGSSHGTSVAVNNLTNSECLFYGYVTPCQYNQPYLYNNEIEIEAVDAISTLQDFKYSYLNGKESSVAIMDIIKKLMEIAGYSGKIYMQYNANKMWAALNYTPTQYEYINDAIFFEDDGEASDCYAVLEEICNFYGISCVPYGNDVFFVDYQIIANVGDDDLLYTDLKSLAYSTFYITDSITKEDYAGDDQNLEMDEVYNKINIKADVAEVKDDDLGVDPEDEIKNSTYYDTRINAGERSDGKKWSIASRYFEYIQGTSANDNSDNWQTPINCNITETPQGYILQNNFAKTYPSISLARMVFPYGNGAGIFNFIAGQCCLPTQQFGYESTKEMPYSTKWNNMLSFFTQGYWLYRYYRDTTRDDLYTEMQKYWEGDFYTYHLGGKNPVLIYNSPKYVNYSPAEYYKTSYLCFTGNLFYQRECKYDKVHYNIWTINEDTNYCDGINVPITEFGCTGTDNAYSRRKGDADYNKGWNMLKLKLSIGNKYWNGSQWTTKQSICWIPYHKDNVVTDDECLIWTGWNKPVTNHNYTYKVNKDAFVIPINKDDNLQGYLKLEVYMPKIPWNNQIYKEGYKLRINYNNIPPVIFMKDFGLTLCTTDNSERWYNVFEDDEEDDDIIYSNTIDSNNVTDMDDLELKINTYNSQKPIAKSYIIEPSIVNGIVDIDSCKYHSYGFYNSLTNNSQRQEMNLVDKYYNHYSTPKKIYNCVVHGYKAPYKCVQCTAISGKYIVDEQSYDLKADVNELKLIEV